MSTNPTVLDLSDCIDRWSSKGYAMYVAINAPHPKYRNEVQATFEHMAKDMIGNWCDDAASCHAWAESIDPIDHSRFSRVDIATEWRTDSTSYRFSINVPGLEVDDLWWMLNESVVYKHTKDVEIDFGPGSIQEITGELEVEAQVVGATKINGGLQVHMVIYHFRDGINGDSWGDTVEGGFAHWKHKGKS
jgi:hypothetical protein